MKKLLIKRWLKNYLFLIINFVIIEILFTLLDGSFLSKSIIRIITFNSLIALTLSFALSFLKDKINKILNVIIVFLMAFYAFIQLGFNNFLGVYASLNTSSQLGAVKDYVREFILSFKWTYYLIFIPALLNIIFVFILKKYKLNDDFKDTKLIIRFLLFFILLIISGFLYYATLKVKLLQNKYQTINNINLFKIPDPPSMAVRQLGIIAFGFSDVKNHFLPSEDSRHYYEYNKKEEQKTDYSRNIDDTILENIISDETNDTYNNINKYFINQEITPKNDYTGLFKNKNLIVIMMESVNDIFINEEYFPNFYKLYNDGWHWENNYSPRNSCSTGNNELSGLISQYSIYNTCTANYYKNNTYFTSMFNLFNNKGYYTSSFHNYTEAYYYRATIHPNLGSQKYYGVKDLGIEYKNEYRNWSSDADLMSKYLEIIDTYDQDKPFMNWITTVSSHQPYSVSSILGDKYLNDFKDTDYPTDLKRYLSKLKVLDEGLGILLDGLEQRNILDDTVIVLYGDHYPYGLSKETINNILSYNLDDYEVERVPFVIYNSKEKSTTYKEYTSYMNILPTIANLFDLDFDPRYYMGHDLFDKNYENKVVFADGSWKNDKVYYNASNDQLDIFEDDYKEEDIIEITKRIREQIDISKEVIKNNYFNYLEKKINDYKIESDE